MSKGEWSRVSINITESDKRKLMRMAGFRGISVSFLMRDIMQDAFDEYEERWGSSFFSSQDDEAS